MIFKSSVAVPPASALLLRVAGNMRSKHSLKAKIFKLERSAIISANRMKSLSSKFNEIEHANDQVILGYSENNSQS